MYKLYAYAMQEKEAYHDTSRAKRQKGKKAKRQKGPDTITIQQVDARTKSRSSPKTKKVNTDYPD
jgi:hypothetical protein